jgi:hypothetical protein
MRRRNLQSVEEEPLDPELTATNPITPPPQTDARLDSADKPLDPNAILTAEFNYIAQTAFQANEDRARVTNFYLITLAGFVAAILGMRFEGLMLPYGYWAFVALFVILALASLLTLLQLVRLRQAWFDSVSAMNRLKDYYARHVGDPQLEEAFAWKALFLQGTSPGAWATCWRCRWPCWAGRPWGRL